MLVVDLVVKPSTVHPAVQPVVAIVFHNREDSELQQQRLEGGEREAPCDACELLTVCKCHRDNTFSTCSAIAVSRGFSAGRA